MTDNSLVCIIDEGCQFDDDLVRSKYLDACSKVFNKPLSVTGPWTIKARECVVQCIKDGDLENASLIYSLRDNILTDYQIVMEDGVEKLVLKGTTTEVLPYEECFDIFVDAHKTTDHGDFTIMHTVLMDKFYVNDICLKIFLDNCNVCKNKSVESKSDTFNDCVIIEIVKVPVIDLENNFILFYIDKATKFTLFKPLRNQDELELSIELFKIFIDFGPPLRIETRHTELLNTVMCALTRGGLKYNIQIQEKFINLPEINNFMDLIMQQGNPTGSHWTTYMRIIQMKHNNNDLPEDILTRPLPKISPLNQVFSVKRDSDTGEVTKIKTETQILIKQENPSTVDNPETSKTKQMSLDEDNEDNEGFNVFENMDMPMIDCEPGTSNDPKISLNMKEMLVQKEADANETLSSSHKSIENDSTQIKSDLKDSPESSERSSITGSDKVIFDNYKLCSVCKGKMFTDYSCYGCKKRTHIFCLRRVQRIMKNDISTFSFCRVCLQTPSL